MKLWHVCPETKRPEVFEADCIAGTEFSVIDRPLKVNPGQILNALPAGAQRFYQCPACQMVIFQAGQ